MGFGVGEKLGVGVVGLGVGESVGLDVAAVQTLR